VSVYAGIRASQAETKAIVDRDRAVAAEQAVAIERDRAVDAELRATQALLEVEQTNKDLEDSYEEIYVASKMLKELSSFTTEILSLGAPRNAQGKMLTTHDLALVATEEITKRFAGLPYLEFASRYSIGKLLWELGDLDNAKMQLEQSLKVYGSLGDERRTSHWLLTSLAYSKVLLDLGDSVNAKEIAQAVIQSSIVEFGLESEKVLKAKNLLAEILGFSHDHEGALELQREIVDAIDAGVSVSHEFDLEARIGLAEALYLNHMLSGAGEETHPLLVDSLLAVERLLPAINEDLGILHPISIDARILLASCLMQVMRIDESVPILEQAYEDASKIYGPNHYKTAEAAGALGSFYFYRGIPESETLLREAIKIYTEVLGTNHQSGINFRSTLGQLLVTQNRFDEAETILQQNMQDLPEGPSFARTQTIGSLAYALMMQGKFEEGEPLWQVTVDDLITAKAGEMSQGIDGMRFIKAHAYILNDHPNADEVVDEFISRHIKLYGSTAPQLFTWMYVLGEAYFQTDKPERGLEFINSYFNTIRSDPDSTDDELFTVVRLESRVALFCIEANKYAEALEILQRITPIVSEELGETHEKVIELQVLLDDVISKLAEENVSP